ncbi:MAG TPA: class I SAM-dependent methyltransferase [Gaiellaceae bacterium]
MARPELSADAERNREVWTKENRDYTGPKAREAWAEPEIRWGVFQVPEAELRALPEVAGKDVVELGCGTAYFSAWLARRGARPVGVDVTPAQLETARRCQQEFGLVFPLLEASAEEVPLPDSSFDLALSEYGASIWCEPERWLSEAARLLRPGGRLVFLCNSPLSILCAPDEGPTEERLLRPQFGMYRFDWPGEDEGINFYLPHGEWIRLLREHGFEVEALHELQAPASARDHPHYEFVPAEWARKWPAEEIWRARKRG